MPSPHFFIGLYPVLNGELQAIAVWEASRDANDTDAMEEGGEVGDVPDAVSNTVNGGGLDEFVAHVPVPSQKEIEEMLLERRKSVLVKKYASSALIQDDQKVRSLLGETK